MKHPTNDWEWEDTAEVAFQEWFNGDYGNFTFRCEYFYGDCAVEDLKTREDLLKKCFTHRSLQVIILGDVPRLMTERNFKKELSYSTYIDMEAGNDTETIDYLSLIHIITELCGRIEELEKSNEYLKYRIGYYEN